MKVLVKPLFTTFVITMIVLPLPPSTIIGLALVANPKTGKYIDHRALSVMYFTGRVVKKIVVWKATVLVSLHEARAQDFHKQPRRL